MRHRRSVLILGLAALIALTGLAGCSRKLEPPQAVAFAWGTAGGTGEFAVAPLRQGPTEIWKVTLPGNDPTQAYPEGTSFSLVAADGKVFVGTRLGQIHAYELSSGKLVWSHGELSPADRPRTARVDSVADGVVFASIEGEGLLALRATDGYPVWTDKSDVWSPTTLWGTTLISTSGTGFATRDRKSGREGWHDDETGHLMAAPVASDSTVCSATLDLQVLALDAATGQRKWRTQFSPLFANEVAGDFSREDQDHTLLTQPVIAGGLVYVVECPWSADPQPGSAAGPARVYALDLASGEIRWQQDIQLPQKPGAKSRLRVQVPAVGGSVLVLNVLADNEVNGPEGQSDTLTALDAASGQVKWTNDISVFTNIQVPLVIGGDTVYAFLRYSDSTVHAFDVASGAELWAINTLSMWKNTETGYPLALFPVDGGLIVSLSDGTVRLFR